jgi:dihydroorotate dehydrogenase (fumarate)
MADLRTRYLGMELRSPLVASSSPLTGTLDGLRRLEAAGAGAVVLPSLFEEDLAEETQQVDALLATGATGAEARAGHPHQAGYGAGPGAYLSLVAQAKAALSIPVVASLNGVSRGGWVRYASRLEAAGADALELNIYYVSSRPGLSGSEVEWHYLDVVRAVRQAIGIPLAVKLSPYFSSLANMAGQLVEAGADGLVLFNRFYQPDLDIEAMEVRPALELSSSVELRLPLRWIAILHRRPHRHRRGQGAAGRGGRGHDDLGPAAQRPRPPTPPGDPGPRLDGPAQLRDRGAAPRPPEPAFGPQPVRFRTGQLHQDPRLPPGAQPLIDHA